MRSWYYVLATLSLTVYAQIITKSRVIHYAASETHRHSMPFLLSVWLDPWVMSGIAAVVAAGTFWILALRRADLSFIYPIMALSFVLVPLLAAMLFGEKINPLQVLGLFVIVGGVTLATLAR